MPHTTDYRGTRGRGDIRVCSAQKWALEKHDIGEGGKAKKRLTVFGVASTLAFGTGAARACGQRHLEIARWQGANPDTGTFERS